MTMIDGGIAGRPDRGQGGGDDGGVGQGRNGRGGHGPLGEARGVTGTDARGGSVRLTVSLIVAMDETGLIGRANGLPWHIGEDLRRFRRVTMSHPVIMGRRTHEAVGKPLPGRTNIVLTRRVDYRAAAGVVVVHSADEALAAAVDAMSAPGTREQVREREVFVIGGAQVYRRFLERADRLYLTRVQGRHEGDVYFPGPDPASDTASWVLVREEPGGTEGNEHYSFQLYERADRAGGEKTR